jgi:hypothetical protein
LQFVLSRQVAVAGWEADLPEVIVKRLMVGADAERVWAVARDLSAYPNFMDQVLNVAPRHLVDGTQVTDWQVLFNGNELCWTEKDEFWPEELRMTFAQLDGDLAEWSGSFQAFAQSDGVLAQYCVRFDLGVPALAEVLHPLGERAVRANCEQMLEEIERQSRERQSVTDV